MTQAILFQTPGLIDLRAFTTFGVNAKPMTQNPIGYFGTGLKYAIAVLTRLGAQPILWIGRDRYTFYVKLTKFRGQEFPMVRMKRERWSLTRPSHHDLPFTTELGKNWQAWQAFRELEANTRDECGETLTVETQSGSDMWKREPGVPDTTRLLIADCEAFVQAYHDRDQIFLPGGLTMRGSSERVQAFHRPSRHLYYRGLRVADLKKPTIYTYNFLSQLELTEDRTLKYEHSARDELARHLTVSEDEILIEQVLTAMDGNWEHGLDFSSVWTAPSAAFDRVMSRRRSAASRSALKYWGAHYTGPVTEGTWEAHPRPWKADESGWIYDANNEAVLIPAHQIIRPRQLAQDVVDLVNKETT